MIARFEGTLLGLALGDALGGPFEGCGGQDLALSHLDNIACQPRTSDDTAMTIALAESLISRRGYSSDDTAARFVHWARTDGRGIGRSTCYALGLISRGLPWREASRRAHQLASGMSAGNGPLMRSAPLALVFFRNASALISHTLESAKITHWDERAGLGAAAFNLMLAAVLRGETDKQRIVLDAPAPLRSRSPELELALANLQSASYENLSPSGFVFDTLSAAAWSFLNTENFPDLILRTCSFGGDADTISAVAGALAGCYYTVASIPANWLAALREAEKLRSLACGLLEVSSWNEKRGS